MDSHPIGIAISFARLGIPDQRRLCIALTVLVLSGCGSARKWGGPVADAAPHPTYADADDPRFNGSRRGEFGPNRDLRLSRRLFASDAAPPGRDSASFRPTGFNSPRPTNGVFPRQQTPPETESRPERIPLNPGTGGRPLPVLDVPVEGPFAEHRLPERWRKFREEPDVVTLLSATSPLVLEVFGDETTKDCPAANHGSQSHHSEIFDDGWKSLDDHVAPGTRSAADSATRADDNSSSIDLMNFNSEGMTDGAIVMNTFALEPDDVNDISSSVEDSTDAADDGWLPVDGLVADAVALSPFPTAEASEPAELVELEFTPTAVSADDLPISQVFESETLSADNDNLATTQPISPSGKRQDQPSSPPTARRKPTQPSADDDDARRMIHDKPITSLTVDISPRITPDTPNSASGSLSSTGNDDEPKTDSKSDTNPDAAAKSDDADSESARLSAIDTPEFPEDAFAQQSGMEPAMFHVTGTSRPWVMTGYEWQASCLSHKPLYFEDVNAERYGLHHGCLQPVASAGSFAASIGMLPYLIAADCPTDTVWATGHDRPGNCVPYRKHYPPVSIDGSLAQAAVVLGLVLLP